MPTALPCGGCAGERCAGGDHEISWAHPRQPATQLLTPAPWQHAWQPRKLRSSTAVCRRISAGCPEPAALSRDGCASKRRTEGGQIISPQLRCVRDPAKRRETAQQRPPPRLQRRSAAAYHHRLPIPRAKPTARRRRDGSGEWRAGACEERRVTPTAIDAIARTSTMAACRTAAQAAIWRCSSPQVPPRDSQIPLHCRTVDASASSAQETATEHLVARRQPAGNCSRQHHGSIPISCASSDPAPQLAAGFPWDA